MDLSAIGHAVLVAREGRRLEAYRDSVSIWTIGIGHTSAAGPPVVTPGLRLTAAECDALFARDVGRFVRTVATVVPNDLPDHAFDALVSLCFNIGEGAFRRSTVVRRLNAGDRAGAAEAILMWNRPASLIPRRRAEYDQFRTPYATALPRARSTDPTAIPRPAGPVMERPEERPGIVPNPAIGSERRPLPRTPSVRAAPPQRSTAPVSAWARLKTSLRALFGARA
ncbi:MULTISPECIES: lysozyme [Methylobacterium]|uniref:Lysozyme n=1 Tax=Methylobacterium bullatum TaxID=570505 RepID=A0A679JDP9_9HYPH|nr:lysozyme [Methylobacterium sp. Leaf85]KQO52501.1 glycoside hydrolase [Methylobacterium sp. Leaf85]CAA2137808.1 Lysozyme RrrD [Methylobacterium bullatum]